MRIARARITSKGQLTLPVELRRELRLEPGDEIVFEFGDAPRAILVPLPRRPATAFSAALATGPGPTELQELRRQAWRRRGSKLARADRK